MLKTIVGVSVLLVASVGCGPSPLTPTPSPVPGALPSVSGLVTGVEAARQPGVTVRLESSERRILASSQLDQAGRFVLPSVRDFCDVVGSLTVVVGGEGVRTEYRGLPRCSTIIDGPAIELGTIRLQEQIVVVSGRVFNLQLSNGDMDHGVDQYNEGGYECGPCKLLDLVGAREGMTLLVEWSSPDPLVVWLEADTSGWGYHDKLGEYRAAPGQRAIAVPIPANWQQYSSGAWMKIGLPRSSRATGGLVEPANIRVSLR